MFNFLNDKLHIFIFNIRNLITLMFIKHMGLERGPLSLVRSIEELLE